MTEREQANQWLVELHDAKKRVADLLRQLQRIRVLLDGTSGMMPLEDLHVLREMNAVLSAAGVPPKNPKRWEP